MEGNATTPGLLSALVAWLSSNAGWLIGISVGFFLLSLFAVRMVILRIPADYFLPESHHSSPERKPGVALALKVGRNILGVLIIVLGLLLSVPGVPGQGILTLLIGLTLTDFPGKRKLELWFLRKPVIFRGINSMRERAGKPPIELPDGPGEDEDGKGGGRND